MNYYHIKEGVIISGPFSRPSIWIDEHGTHWNPSDEQLTQWGVCPATVEMPDYNPVTHEATGPVISIQDGLPVESYTIIPRCLAELQYNAILQLWSDCRDYIEGPEGSRYSGLKIDDFQEIRETCKEWLDENPDATEEEKTPYLWRITELKAVRVWIAGVRNYGYSVQEQIRNATLENWPIVWDFSQFDESDPDVWLEHVRL